MSTYLRLTDDSYNNHPAAKPRLADCIEIAANGLETPLILDAHAMHAMHENSEKNHPFIRNAVRHMMEHGVQQFVDIGSGISSSTRDIVHSLDSKSSMTNMILNSDQDLRAEEEKARLGDGVVHANLYLPKDALTELSQKVDLSKPTGFLIICLAPSCYGPGLLSFMSTLCSTMANGSYIVVTHPVQYGEGQKDETSPSTTLINIRNKQILEVFKHLEFVRSGIDILDVETGRAKANSIAEAPPNAIKLYGVMRRKSSTSWALLQSVLLDRYQWGSENVILWFIFLVFFVVRVIAFP